MKGWRLQQMKVTVKDGGQGMLLPSKQRVPHTEFHSAYQK